MGLNIGSKIKSIYCGCNIKEAYVGSQKVFGSSEEGYATIGGRKYKTVTIGGVTWMGENLDYKASGITIGASGTPTTSAAWYYNNDESTYGESGKKYGLLYNGYAASYLETNKSTLFPGWHLPSTSEMDALSNSVGGSNAGKLLKSTYDWNNGGNGTDDYGFCAVPAAKRESGTFKSIGNSTHFWATNELVGDMKYVCYFTYDDNSYRLNWYNKKYAFSIRLVKDA